MGTWRRLRGWAIGLALAGLAGAGLWFRPAFTWPIDPVGELSGGSRAIASLEPVTLNGAQEWILVRGEDRSRPVLLMLLGEPGSAEIPIAHALPSRLERDFVVVTWDRRASGKSYPDEGPPPAISMTRDLADAAALAGLLKGRFGGRRIIVLGQGYGSYLGVALADAHPELIRAYVGAGQAACTEDDEHAIQDSWLRQKATLAGDATVFRLAASDARWDRLPALTRYGGALTEGPGGAVAWARLLAPEYRLKDQLKAPKGVEAARAGFVQDGPELPLARSIPAIEVPALFVIGERDHVSPSLCAERYAQAVSAPGRRIVWYAKSAHYPFVEEPRRFEADLDALMKATEERR